MLLPQSFKFVTSRKGGHLLVIQSCKHANLCYTYNRCKVLLDHENWACAGCIKYRKSLPLEDRKSVSVGSLRVIRKPGR